MIQKSLYQVKPEDDIKVEDLNQLVRHCLRMQPLPMQSRGIQIRQTPYGTIFEVQPAQRCLGITSGTISAATVASGVITLGTGSVVRQAITPAGLSEALDTVPVFNFSTTTGGISTGVNVWIEQDMGGNWVICAVDCGN